MCLLVCVDLHIFVFSTVVIIIFFLIYNSSSFILPKHLIQFWLMMKYITEWYLLRISQNLNILIDSDPW